ncbi:TetR family transcriptional regulator [Kribbella sp. VKM Ac-2527]|uniref:TetR family transcriptional regulator n=1 Tax=Kribbella caucasensis TaxID=2512215 RepID=A0A4R6KLV9_9ACTN|nr:TetR/AcrR family transcriptional regulator [Kribbella sp. VKM Ac-2527]TDO50135.1 TetR family transcriptional regulator [Kribbella sp. VKM Ac-2527]
MVRLSRAQQQERTRSAVLAAAREEFAEHTYAEAKVDRIAERAELTRGAVYSNFPSKRALYLAVLLDSIEQPAPTPATRNRIAAPAPSPIRPAPPVEPTSSLGPSPIGPTPDPVPSSGALGEALGAVARVWLERLPLVGDSPARGNLQLRSLTGVIDDGPGRAALAQVTRVEALLLGLALESCVARRMRPQRPRPQPARKVRLAAMVLTLLNGAGQLAESAPGVGDPFDVERTCEHLAGLDLADTWDRPLLAYVVPARPADEVWQPPTEAGDGFGLQGGDLADQLTGHDVDFDRDGVIVVLGTGRLGAAEEAIRAVRGTSPRGLSGGAVEPADDQVIVAVVTSDPAELGRLVRLRIGDLTGCLRQVFGPDAWPGIRIVLDDHAAIASAIGVEATDATEAAVRIQGGKIIARAEGRGAAHAAATAVQNHKTAVQDQKSAAQDRKTAAQGQQSVHE